MKVLTPELRTTIEPFNCTSVVFKVATFAFWQQDEEKGKGSSPQCTKSVTERLNEEVRDAKIKVFASLKQGTVEELKEWKELSISLKVVFVTIPSILFLYFTFAIILRGRKGI